MGNRDGLVSDDGQVVVHFNDGTAEIFPCDMGDLDADLIGESVSKINEASDTIIFMQTSNGAILIPFGVTKYIEWRKDETA